MSGAGGYDEYAFIADLYDYVVPYRERPDVSFYVEHARQAGGPVLELGCGTGRILLPTARAGMRIVGLDLSPHMLDVCRSRLAAEPPAVRSNAHLVGGDMRSFDLDRSFALVTIPFRAFLHLLTVEEQTACLRCVHRHLIGGGLLAFDLFNPSLDLLANAPLDQEMGEEPEFSMPDGRRVTRRFKRVAHDRAAQVSQIELIYDVTHPDGRRERLLHAFSMRYVFRYEAEHLIARCGFELLHVYGEFDKRPFGSTYPGEIICVARKADPGSAGTAR
jgi:SAM-dependent methyltransferase